MPEWVWSMVIGANVVSTLSSCSTIHRLYVRERQQQERWCTLEREQMQRWQAAFLRLAQEEHPPQA